MNKTQQRLKEILALCMAMYPRVLIPLNVTLTFELVQDGLKMSVAQGEVSTTRTVPNDHLLDMKDPYSAIAFEVGRCVSDIVTGQLADLDTSNG